MIRPKTTNSNPKTHESNNFEDINNKINEYKKSKILSLAPMVNNSAKSYRILSRILGANMVYTEMINCDSYLRGQNKKCMDDFYNNKTLSKIFKTDYINDLVIQLAGNNKDTVLRVAKSIIESLDRNIWGIDINLGCPQNIARRGNYGSFLVDETACEILKHLVENLSPLNIRVSCKIRIKTTLNETLEYVKKLESTGISMLTVHGRKREQKGQQTGLANWEVIRKIKEIMKIPVVANGNIACQKDIIDIIEYTKCDGVMTAETHLYDPLIFNTRGFDKEHSFYHSVCDEIGEIRSIYDVLSTYFTICIKDKSKIRENFGEIKSHVFKLLYDYFEQNPEKRSVLDAIRRIEGYKSFIDEHRKEFEEIVPKPRLRNPYVEPEIHIEQSYKIINELPMENGSTDIDNIETTGIEVELASAS